MTPVKVDPPKVEQETHPIFLSPAQIAPLLEVGLSDASVNYPKAFVSEGGPDGDFNVVATKDTASYTITCFRDRPRDHKLGNETDSMTFSRTQYTFQISLRGVASCEVEALTRFCTAAKNASYKEVDDALMAAEGENVLRSKRDVAEGAMILMKNMAVNLIADCKVDLRY